MSMTTMIRIEKLNAGEYSGQRAHDLRQSSAEHPLPHYVDPRLSTENSVLIEHVLIAELHDRNAAAKAAAKDAAGNAYATAKSSGEAASIEAARQAKQACRQGYVPSGVVGYSGLIAFGTDAQQQFAQLPRVQQNEYFTAAAKAITAEMGVDLVGLVVHRDETAVHAQFVTTAVTHRGSKVRLQPEDCSRLQDIGAAPFARLGFSRGVQKEVRKAQGDGSEKTKHRDVRRLHQDLPREIAAKELELARLLEHEQVLRAQFQGEIARLEELSEKWTRYVEFQKEKSRHLDAQIKEKTIELEKLMGMTDESQSIAVVVDAPPCKLPKIK